MAINRDLLYSKINKIKDPIQRVMLQDILLDVFTQLVEYNDSCFQELEERIDKEEKESFCPYFVYTGVCKRENFDVASQFWFELVTEPTKREEHRLDTIFLACNYDTIFDCLKHNYTAAVYMEDSVETIDICFSYSKKYLDKIEWLYQQFGQNRKKWQTINCPYLYKFLDIIDINKKIPIDKTIEKIELNIGELGNYILTDVMLVWNIEETVFQTEAIKTAGEKVIQFEHEIKKCEIEDGYLFILDENESFYSLRTEDAILVRTENRPYEEISSLHFIPHDEIKDNMELLYPLQTNKRRNLFVDRFAKNQDMVAHTLGEIKRILGLYPILGTEGVELYKVEIKTKKELDKEIKEQKDLLKLDYNSFIPSHQLWNKEMEEVFYFHIKDKSSFLTKELVAFLLSELQLSIVEYQCVGIINET